MMTRNDQEILKTARDYNVGDLNLGYTLKTRNKVEGLVNREQLGGNILPLMLVNRSNPDRNYSYAWCPLDESPHSKKYVADMKADGFMPVIQSEWILDSDLLGWEKRKLKWGVTSALLNPYDEFLMYRDEVKWAEHQANKARFNTNRIEARQSDSLEQAARISHDSGVGVEVAATLNGEETSIRPSTKRTIS